MIKYIFFLMLLNCLLYSQQWQYISDITSDNGKKLVFYYDPNSVVQVTDSVFYLDILLEPSDLELYEGNLYNRLLSKIIFNIYNVTYTETSSSFYLSNKLIKQIIYEKEDLTVFNRSDNTMFLQLSKIIYYDHVKKKIR